MGFLVAVAVLLGAQTPAFALTQLLNKTLSGDYVSAGVGLNGLSSANITIAGIPAGSTVVKAYLYWGFEDAGPNPAQANLTFNGTPLTGTLIGSGGGIGRGAMCFAYRADVTAFVAGNGVYALTGVLMGAPTVGEGASLVVIYSNPVLPTRTVIVLDGNDIINGASPPSITNTMGGFIANSPVNARTTFIVGGGDAGLADQSSFAGSLGTLNLNNTFNSTDGHYWDNNTYNVSPYIGPGSTSASVTLIREADFVMWVAQVLSVGSSPASPPPSAPSGSPGEGSFAGVDPPPPPGGGSEGGFGNSGHLAFAPVAPALVGPFQLSSTNALTPATPTLATCPPAGTQLQVFNVSFQRQTQVNESQGNAAGIGVFGLALLTGLVAVGTAALALAVKGLPTSTDAKA